MRARLRAYAQKEKGGAVLLKCLDPMRELTLLSILFRFLLSAACGAVIGYERSRSRHAAGLRTHIVVCIGAASVMLLSQYLTVCFDAATDPARLGAQVISGIGFLGAGTIVITGHQQGKRITGLTTAAGLWASACMGLVIGSGFYEAAVIMCALLACVIVGLNRLEERYLKDSTVLRLYIEYSRDIPFSAVHAVLRANGWHLAHLEYPCGKQENINSVLADVQRSGTDTDRQSLLRALRDVNGVSFVEEA